MCGCCAGLRAGAPPKNLLLVWGPLQNRRRCIHANLNVGGIAVHPGYSGQYVRKAERRTIPLLQRTSIAVSIVGTVVAIEIKRLCRQS